MKHEKLFQGKVGDCNESEVQLKFKEGVRKCHQCQPHAAVEAQKKLIKSFFDNLCEQKVLQKEGTITWLSPVFCQGKTNGEIRLLTDLRKLNDVLKRDEWSFETIDSILNSMGQFNCIAVLDQFMGYHAMSVRKEDQQCLGIAIPWGCAFITNYRRVSKQQWTFVNVKW